MVALSLQSLCDLPKGTFQKNKTHATRGFQFGCGEKGTIFELFYGGFEDNNEILISVLLKMKEAHNIVPRISFYFCLHPLK